MGISHKLRYDTTAVATAVAKYDSYSHFHLDNRKSALKHLSQNGVSNFTKNHFLQRPMILPSFSKHYVDVLISIYCRLRWLRETLDGRSGWDQLRNVKKMLGEIHQTADKLARLLEHQEQFFKIDHQVINYENLSKIRDSKGVHHQDMKTFFGGLFSRCCVDATVIYEGLSGFGDNFPNHLGKPPKVSENWLILVGFDLFEGRNGRGSAAIGKTTTPTIAEDYYGPCLNFLHDFTDLLAPESFLQKKVNTGFGSRCEKLLKLYRADPTIMHRAFAFNSYEDLLFDINAIAGLGRG